MQRTAVNPWSWSLEFGFNQAELVEGARRILVCSGQTATDADGRPRHPGDMAAQLAMALDNLEAVLAAAGMGLGDVVRLQVYTTDVDRLLEHYRVVVERLEAAGVRPASTLLGVARLAAPELLVELEATAMA
jgi:enamine deaminase RidA (YjgF/YER057c/UK114 family)